MQTLIKHYKHEWANKILVGSYLTLVKINAVIKQQVPGIFLFACVFVNGELKPII